MKEHGEHVTMAPACVDGGNDFEEAEGPGQHVAGEEKNESL